MLRLGRAGLDSRSRLRLIPSLQAFNGSPTSCLTDYNSRCQFHTIPRRQSSVIEAYLEHTHTFIAGVHSVTGLPWVLSLPLTGLLVRAFFITPLQLYSHKQIARRIALQPLLSAWRHVMQRKVLAEHGSRGPEYCQKMLRREMARKSMEVNRGMGLFNLGVFVPLLQLPIWLGFIETIRRMSGAHAGLIGLVMNASSSSDAKAATDTLQTVAEGGGVPIETTFAIEGALWFPDLLVPDPFLILPFVLSASMLANIYYQERQKLIRSTIVTTFSRRLTNALKLIALAVGPLTLNLPSAMLVYWISSAGTALAQSILMDRYRPLSPAVQPCKPKQEVF